MQSKGKHELVWNCCNPFVAALLAAAQGVHRTPAERMVGVWDTQYYSSCGAKQPDQSICAITCRPSEHIAVGYNEVAYERFDPKHVGKMGQYLKTVLEENPQLVEAYGLLMCKSAVQVHRIVRMPSNGREWPFEWESSPELVLQEEGGEVPHLTQLWLAHWADCVVQLSNDVTTSYEIATEGGTLATAAFGAHVGQGASSRVFSSRLTSELGEEHVALKVLHRRCQTKEPRELHLLRHFSNQLWTPTLKGVSRDRGDVVAIAMEYAGRSVARGGLTQSMFETPVRALRAIHSAPRTVAEPDQGDDSGGCWVHCDIRPANVSTNGAKLYLLDLGACTWSTTEPDHYVGTFHCASDEILDYLVDYTSGRRDARCPKSKASDLVSAVRTAMLLSLGVAVQDVVYSVPVDKPERMKRVWHEVTPPAWLNAIEHAGEGNYDAVTTAVKKLLPCKIPRKDAEVEAAALADAMPGAVGTGAAAGTGGAAGAGAAGAGASPGAVAAGADTGAVGSPIQQNPKRVGTANKHEEKGTDENKEGQPQKFTDRRNRRNRRNRNRGNSEEVATSGPPRTK